MTTGRNERIAKGVEVAQQIFKGGVSIPAPKEIDRDWRRFVTATVMGDIWSRPALDLKTRGLITLAALTALNRRDQMRMYLKALPNLGITREEISEVIMHTAIYGGFPVAVDGMAIAHEVFAELDAEAEQG